MSLISRLFSKSSVDFLARGDALLSARRFYEARTCYEQGVERYLKKRGGEQSDETADRFRARIADANRELAGVNIVEAERAMAGGAVAKAMEHLELALSLTDDAGLREKSRALLATLADRSERTAGPVPPLRGGCGNCASPAGEQDELAAASSDGGAQLSDSDYYDLLIRQLPGHLYARYNSLGDDFENLYLAASRDEHENALYCLEAWYKGVDDDIYWYEKGTLLHRLGRSDESESCFRNACRVNQGNPLPPFGLALLLIDAARHAEAAEVLDVMISRGMLSEQALMLRGDLSMLSGDTEGAISRYGMLLSTPHARAAAEKLHHVLLHSGRKQEAAALFKKYLGGCRH